MGTPREPVPEPLRRHGVTARERDVLREVVDRRRNPEIAERLVISVRTVESHVASLLRKLHAEDRAALVEAGRSLQRPPGLPVPATSFVGRRVEQRRLGDLLARHRLVTLTGPGGVGKTRLALQLAGRTTAGTAPDEAHLVDLSAVTRGEDVELRRAFADALGVREPSVGDGWREAVRDRRGLVVVDNCEHLVAAAARHVAELLASAPGLRVLATSREPLRTPGEVVFVVPPLVVDHDRGPRDAPTDAEELFIARARAAAPDVPPHPDDATAVRELCRALDGLPLAIELAAAQVRTFTVHQLLAHLGQRFELLVAGVRTAQPRQQTLQATLDWSHDLLDDDERRLLARLGVFGGSFDYDAVAAVCTDGDLDAAAVLRLLPRLQDKSLVTRLTDSDSRRFRLGESVRHYVRARGGQDPGIHDRHAAHYLKLAEAAAGHLRGHEQRRWLQRLEGEQHNLHDAMTWTAATGARQDAQRLFAALAPFWEDSGRVAEAPRWIGDVVAPGTEADAAVAPAVTAAATIAASTLLRTLDVRRARAFAEQAIALTAPGDGLHASALSALGWALAYDGHPDEAAAVLRRALDELEDDDPWGRAAALQGLALVATQLPQTVELARAAGLLYRDAGDRRRQANALYTMASRALDAGVTTDEVRAWLTDSRDLGEQVDGEHHVAHATLGLARLGWLRGEEGVEAHLTACLPVLRRLGDLRCTGRALLVAARVARQEGDLAREPQLLRDSLRAARPAADHATAMAATALLERTAYPEPDAKSPP